MPIVTPQERVGTVLGGKYRLGSMLGKGGMGAVFRGEHELTGRAVAIKLLHAEHTQSEEVCGRFLREARTAAGLKHPNVVDVLDMGREDDTVYMVLELLEGEALSTLLHDEGSLPVERAAEVLLPVMRAVAMAHGRSVVHRDLKPENIFLHHDATGAEVPKILDFGIAKALGEEQDGKVTQTGFVLGTPAYMSPEQAEGIPEKIGPAADVWSMGVVWYEALSGSLPFGGQTHTAILLSVVQGKFQRLTRRAPGVPVALAAAIDKALVKDVSRRYPDMGAFLQAIERALDAPDEAPRESVVSHEPSLPPSLTAPWTMGGPDAPRAVKIELGPPAEEPAGPQTPIPLVRRSQTPRPPPSDSLVAPVTLATAAPSRSGARLAIGVAVGVAVAAGVAALASGTFRAHPPQTPRAAARPLPAAPTLPAAPSPPAAPTLPAVPAPDVAPAAQPTPAVEPAPAPPAGEHPRRRRGRRDDPEEGPTAEELRANPSLILAPHAPPTAPPTAPAVSPPPPPPPPPPAPPPPTPTRSAAPAHAPMRDYEPTP